MTFFHYLYSGILLFHPCYPEGNFGGNQLLDGSISLSPLYEGEATDLHVRTASGFHQRFLLASPSPRIVHHLSGLIHAALHRQLDMKWQLLEVHPTRPPEGLHSQHRESPWSVFQDGSLSSRVPHVSFHGRLNSLFKGTSTFPSRYFYTIEFQSYLSLRWNVPPFKLAISSKPTRLIQSLSISLVFGNTQPSPRS